MPSIDYLNDVRGRWTGIPLQLAFLMAIKAISDKNEAWTRF